MKISESTFRAIIRAEARRLYEGGEFPEEKYGHHDLPFGQEPGPEDFDGDDDYDYDDAEVAWDENAAEMMADMDEPLGIDEARKRGKSVVKKGGKKASAGSVSIFKKAAAKAKGGEEKKKHAGFKAVKKSAEKWADEPAAVAQAATMVATGEPVVAKGEKKGGKKRVKESTIRSIVLKEISKSVSSEHSKALNAALAAIAEELYEAGHYNFESFDEEIFNLLGADPSLNADALEQWHRSWIREHERDLADADRDEEELARLSGKYGGFIP